MLTGTLFAPEVERMAHLTQPGMAYFADSGPAGETCQNCAHFDLHDETGRRRKAHCRKYAEMTHRCGPMVPKRTPACKYFVAK